MTCGEMEREREKESQKTPLQSYMWLIQEIAANKQEAEG